MRIEQDQKLDYSDVLIRPKRSTLGSRKEVRLERRFTFCNSKQDFEGIPIMASNMDGVGTMEMGDFLASGSVFTCLVKTYSVNDLVAYFDNDMLLLSVSLSIFSMFKGTGDTSQLGGPIKIAKITGQVAKFGIVAFLSIMAYISISLGFINLFPIPMLDGGHLMFYAFEKILGRPLTQKTQEGFFRIGLFLLLSLMFFTTFNDLKDLGLF